MFLQGHNQRKVGNVLLRTAYQCKINPQNVILIGIGVNACTSSSCDQLVTVTNNSELHKSRPQTLARVVRTLTPNELIKSSSGSVYLSVWSKRANEKQDVGDIVEKTCRRRLVIFSLELGVLLLIVFYIEDARYNITRSRMKQQIIIYLGSALLLSCPLNRTAYWRAISRRLS